MGHPIVRNGTVWSNCVKLRESIKLLFGVELGWLTDGCIIWKFTCPKGKGRFWEFYYQLVWMALFKQKCIRLLHKKLTIFPHGQCIIENICSMTLKVKLVSRSKFGCMRNLQNITVILIFAFASSKHNSSKLHVHEVNITISSILLPVAQFLHGLASQLGYFELVWEKI